MRVFKFLKILWNSDELKKNKDPVYKRFSIVESDKDIFVELSFNGGLEVGIGNPTDTKVLF